MLHSKTAIAPEIQASGSGGAAPPPIIGKEWPTHRYGALISRYPAIFMAVSVFVPLIITIIALGATTTIDVQTESFAATGTNAYQNQKAVKTAETYWEAVMSIDPNTIYGSIDKTKIRHKPTYRITLQFVLHCNRNEIARNYSCESLLSKEGLRLVKQVEEAATAASTGYRGLCWVNDIANAAQLVSNTECAPVNSVTQYFFPTIVTAEPYFILNGKGDTMMDMDSGMKERLLLNPKIDWYMGPNFRTTGLTTVLRSQLVLGTPIARGFSQEDTEAAVDDYIVRMYDAVMAVPTPPNVTVTVGGDRVVEALVVGAMSGESYKVPLACLIVVVVHYAHARSVVIAILGGVQVLLTYLTTISIYSMGSGGKMPLLGFISLFFTIVWSVDGILVLYDNFVHSGIIPTTGRKNTLSVAQRISYVIRKGLKGILTAHLCALVAFSVNTLSPVKELREFAVVMIVMILVSSYFFLLYTPSMVLFHHFYFSKRRRNLQRQKELMLANGARERYVPMACLLEELESLKSLNGSRAYTDIEAARAQRKREGKEKRGDIMTRTTLVTNVFASEWNVRYRLMSERAEVRRRRKRDEQDELQAERVGMNVLTPRDLPEDGEDFHAVAAGSPRNADDDGGESEQQPQHNVVVIQSKNFDAADVQAGLDEFADINEEDSAAARAAALAASSSGLYRSMRHIPTASVIHLPPQLCFRTPESVDYARRLVTARLEASAVTEAPLTAQNLAYRGRSNYDGDDDEVEELVLDDEGKTRPTEEAQQAAPPVLRLPVLDEHDASFGPGSVSDPLARLEAMALPFNTAWNAIADEIEILPGDSTMAEVSGLLAHRLISTLVGHPVAPDAIITRYDNPAQAGARMARVGFVDLDGREQQVQQQYGAAAENDERAVEVGCGPFRKMSTVRRKWCCGRFGKRVEETREERDERLMQKKVKHEGYGRLERFFNNQWAGGIHRARRVIALLFLLALGLSIWGVTELKAVDSHVQLLSDNQNQELFEQHAGLFAVKNTPCDFCSGNYRDVREFRAASKTTFDACQAQGYTNAIVNAYADDCGKCFGSNACQDCRGVAYGDYAIDSCGQCVARNSTNLNSCTDCRKNPTLTTPECQHCNMFGGVLGGGPSCATPCTSTTCPPSRGRCSKYTGECICHQSRELGYFESDPTSAAKCTLCSTGFTPTPNLLSDGVACRFDCVGSSPSATCKCDPNTRLCTACAYGFIGGACDVQDPKLCKYGVMNSTSKTCACNSGYSGAACAGHAICNGRGLWRSSLESPVQTCECVGNWAGKFCGYCRCQNGGTCNEDGSCTCAAGWGGPSCASCNSACTQHGTCPAPFTSQQYDPLTCMGVYCSDAELRADFTCAPCVRTFAGMCGAYMPPVNNDLISDRIALCAADGKCFWNVTAAGCFERVNRSIPVLDTQLYCSTCRGYWLGPSCSACNAPTGVTGGCNTDGSITACDGRRYMPGQEFPVVDSCGVCGGTNRCVGCDGAISGTPAVVDRCGICGGDGVCPGEKGPFEVKLTYGIMPLPASDPSDYGGASLVPSFNFASSFSQYRFVEVCRQIRDHTTGDNTQADLLSCPYLEMEKWIRLPENLAKLGLRDQVAFPGNLDEKFITRALYTFVMDTNRQHDVGFSSNQPTDPDFRVRFMTMRLRALAEHNGNADRLLFLAQRFDVLATSIAGVTGAFTMQISDKWIEAHTELQSRAGLAWSSCVGFAVFLMVMHILTCSITTTIIAALAVGFSFIVSLAFFSAFGFTLGAVEQLGISLLLGMAVEHTIHFLDTYLDTVQGAQSHLFAREVSRLAALRTAFAQSATPILASSVTTVLVAIMYASSPVQPFRRASEIAIIVTLVSLCTSLVVVGAFLVMAGPIATFRIVTIAVTILIHWIAAWGVVVLALYLGKVRAPDGTTAVG
jgi:hypothetical protein